MSLRFSSEGEDKQVVPRPFLRSLCSCLEHRQWHRHCPGEAFALKRLHGSIKEQRKKAELHYNKILIPTSGMEEAVFLSANSTVYRRADDNYCSRHCCTCFVFVYHDAPFLMIWCTNRGFGIPSSKTLMFVIRCRQPFRLQTPGLLASTKHLCRIKFLCLVMIVESR